MTAQELREKLRNGQDVRIPTVTSPVNTTDDIESILDRFEKAVKQTDSTPEKIAGLLKILDTATNIAQAFPATATVATLIDEVILPQIENALESQSSS